MKLTATESKALDRAKGLEPLTDSERDQLPADSGAWTPQQRRRCREDRLCHAAEALKRRQLRNDLYRHAVKTNDRSGIRDYRVTALDTSTVRIRRELIDAYRALLELRANQPPEPCEP